MEKHFIIKTDVSKFRPTTPSNENINRYSQFKRIFKSHKEILGLAEPVREDNGRTIKWRTDISGKLTPFSKLSEEEKEKYKRLLKRQVNRFYVEVLRQAGDQQEEWEQIIDDSIEIPDYDSIYIARLPNHSPRFLLINWGFISEYNLQTGLVKALIATELTTANFKVVYKDHTKAPNEEFLFSIKEGKATEISDQNGFFKLEDIPFNTTFTAYQQNEQGETTYQQDFICVIDEESFTIVLDKPSPKTSDEGGVEIGRNEGEEDGEIESPPIEEPIEGIAPHIKTVRNKDKIVSRAKVSYDYNHQKIEYTTNEDGIVTFQLPPFKTEFTVSAKKGLWRGKETFVSNGVEGEYKVKLSLRWLLWWLIPVLLGLGLLFFFLLFDFPQDYQIEVLEKGSNKPIANAEVIIQADTIQRRVRTDSLGIVKVSDLPNNATVYVGTQTEDYTDIQYITTCCNDTTIFLPSLIAVNPILPCDTESESGGEGDTRNEHELGIKKGKFKIEYDMVSVPDQMIIYCGRAAKISEDRIIWQTDGFVSGDELIELPFDCNSSIVTVRVIGSDSRTAWGYQLYCPE